MFAVHAEAASDVRRLLDRQSRETVLGRPHCAFLMCLFRSLDDNAVEFLNTFAEAIDTETGEAVMMIVLFDSVGILGESAAHHMSRTSSVIPPASERPLLQCEAVLKGAREVDLFYKGLDASRLQNGIPDFATYRASPQWSLKFSDAVGLDRTALPCILAFDDESISADGACTILPIDNPAETWNLLRRALDIYALDEQVQAFSLTVESMDDAERLGREIDQSLISINDMASAVISEWKTLLDLGATAPSQRLEDAVRPIRWATLNGPDGANEPTRQLLELLGNAQRCKNQRKFVVAYEAIQRLDLYDTVPHAQARKIKTYERAAILLGETADEISESVAHSGVSEVMSRLSHGAPLDIEAMYGAISAVRDRLSSRTSELLEQRVLAEQRRDDFLQKAQNMPRVSFRQVLDNVIDSSHSKEMSRWVGSKRTVRLDYVQMSTGILNLLSAAVDLIRRVTG